MASEVECAGAFGAIGHDNGNWTEEIRWRWRLS